MARCEIFVILHWGPIVIVVVEFLYLSTVSFWKKSNLKTWHCFPKKLQNQHFWNSLQWKLMKTIEMLRAYILLYFPYFQPIVPTFLLYESFVPFLQICWTFGLKKPQGALVLMMSWTIVALVVSAMVVNVLD